MKRKHFVVLLVKPNMKFIKMKIEEKLVGNDAGYGIIESILHLAYEACN